MLLTSGEGQRAKSVCRWAMKKDGRSSGMKALEVVCRILWDLESWLIRLTMTEMLHHALSGTLSPDATNNIVLRAEDKTSAGDNLVFLKSKLTWDVGKDGKERVLDADGNG